jgi:guanylate kinase
MQAARTEISHWAEFDHLVINADLDQAIADVRAILQAARLATPRQLAAANLARTLS